MLSSSYDNLLEGGICESDGERVLVVYNRDVERRCRVLDGDKEIALTLPSGASTLLAAGVDLNDEAEFNEGDLYAKLLARDVVLAGVWL